jgi:hypothetical protein
MNQSLLLRHPAQPAKVPKAPYNIPGRGMAEPAAGPTLRGVFYSEFDNIVGPKITYHAGECPGSEVFDRVSDYVITKPQLVRASLGWGRSGFPLGGRRCVCRQHFSAHAAA